MKVLIFILIGFTYLHAYSQNDSIHYCNDCLTPIEVDAYEKHINAVKVYIPIYQVNKFTCESDLNKIIPSIDFSTISHNNLYTGCCFCYEKDSIYIRIDSINGLHKAIYYKYMSDWGNFYSKQVPEMKRLNLLHSIKMKVFTKDTFLSKYISLPVNDTIQYKLIRNRFDSLRFQLDAIVGYLPEKIKKDNALNQKIKKFFLLPHEPMCKYKYKYAKDFRWLRYESKSNQMVYKENQREYVKLSLINEITANIRFTTLTPCEQDVVLNNNDVVLLIDIDRTDVFGETLHQNCPTMKSLENHIESMVQKYQTKK